jgi:hypothetical protein
MHCLHLYLMFIFCWPSVSMAEIFKCQRSDGSVYYQDRDCKLKSHQQTKVVVFEQPRNLKEVKAIEKQLTQQRKQIIQHQKQQKKQKELALKKLEKEKQQRAKMRIKCAETKRKIDGITQHYRSGYTIKQGISLDGKLAKYKDEKLRYCKYERTN